VLERLIELSGRCRLVPILGNHDQSLLDLLAGEVEIEQFLGIGGAATLASYGHERPYDAPAVRLPSAHIDFLRDCVDYHETVDHIFLHASYLPYLPMMAQPATVLRWCSLRDVTPRPHQSSKRVVVGHTSQKTGTILDLGYLTCIDTYCYGGGWLTALDVYSGQVWQASREGRLRKDPPRLVPWGG
jgi:serine/threonine protein phosphatase 1